MLKRLFKRAKSKLKLAKLIFEGNSEKRWYGSEYGGFYIKEKALTDQEKIIVYSCGVGKDISFDLTILKKYKRSEIFAFDPTPISIKWIEAQNLPDNFYFSPVGISHEEGTQKMFFPKKFGVSYGVFDWDKENKDEITVKVSTIEKIAEKHGHKVIDILKMDIEGSEFDVIKSLDFNKLKVGQLLVEFHERFLDNGKEILAETLTYLEENNFECFAISDDFEYSFINKSLG